MYEVMYCVVLLRKPRFSGTREEVADYLGISDDEFDWYYDNNINCKGKGRIYKQMEAIDKYYDNFPQKDKVIYNLAFNDNTISVKDPSDFIGELPYKVKVYKRAVKLDKITKPYWLIEKEEL